MNDEFLCFNKVKFDKSHYGYDIIDLAKIKPFGAYQYGEYILFTTMSIHKMYYGMPEAYLYYYGSGVRVDISKQLMKSNGFKDQNPCLGKFYALMSKEERFHFHKNIDDIINLLT